ncbi:tRNA N(3)-methylcytidine methyltransferase METTL6 [Diabrotica virgifera virgifera]|uniref:tRNA N(3)-methylcytidine methyltransferase n=1 Tax=Diabrotica virgifera virgifera TaxID=50390 RepID=A0A6P7GR97_DIAVI|nr:tRNA N(3)-methylcytidine methyltransferase METTL6 [Diabrotica virgifera virgifera]XP_050507066.1 tRNA N(3)-methylcytidine methyltransferase METTL6 [Diabrotica virgifera virgifera]
MAENDFSDNTKTLSESEIQNLKLQNSRIISEYKANQLELEAKKHWDLFYKRNENRFFKDRHWTTREFEDLLNDQESDKLILFEIGCGVGNFIFPLIEEGLNFQILACDLSPRAVDIVKGHPSYNSNLIQKVFQCDITTDDVYEEVKENTVDITTLIFVLSAVHPEKFKDTLRRVKALLKPGGLLLFRDYGLYDMAQLRFKVGHKISDNFYMRQDGTRSYFFSTEFMKRLLEECGYEIVLNTYIHRRTVNKKENIDVPRIFVQCKARKPVE